MQYKIIVDRQSRTNPTAEKKEYIIDIEELRCKGDVFDSIVITKSEDYVIRRLELTEYHVLNVLPEPIKQPLPDLNIELFEGNNYIYLIDMTGNRFYAEYLIKNDFTDTYVTKNEMSSAITESANKIELSVNQKLTGYSTTEQVNALLELLADKINIEVSKKINDEDLTGASIILRINNDTSEIQVSADKVDIIGKKVKFKTNVESKYSYTNNDLTNIQQYIMGKYELTDAQKELYDINKDGKVTASDYVAIRNRVDSTNTVDIKGTLEIDPDSGSRTLILRDSSGNIVTSIGLLGMQTDSIYSKHCDADSSTIDNLNVTGTFTNNSDKRLKENIKDVDDVSWIDKLKIKEFEYKKRPNKKHIGIIAQDYLDEEFKKYFLYKNEMDIFTVSYTDITNALIKYCQELKKEVNILKEGAKK